MKSEKIESLVKAVIKARAAFGPIVKSKVNPFYGAKYATLLDIDGAIDASLAANGLWVSQPTEMVGAVPVLVTTLYHESGQFISGQYPLNPVKNDPQGLGSAMTYGRRYALCALLGIVADEDDDGNSASHVSQKTEAKPARTAEKAVDADAQSKEFIPAAVSSKSGEKNGKPWVMFSVKDQDGNWYSTFDEKINEMAVQAKESNNEIKVHFVVKGAYKNIVGCEEGVPF